MFLECNRCRGTGYLGLGGRSDHADICCDDGGKFICDHCDETITDTENLDRCGTHLCQECAKEEEDYEEEDYDD